MNHVIDYYENYREEDRLTRNNTHRIEFLTTIRIFDEQFPPTAKILDCAAGTGIYSFHYADKGYDVTATDLTPKHISYIQEQLKNKPYNMASKLIDATDLSNFEDETFDIVLCMGPFYHITDPAMRNQCLSECIRVLKKGGLLAISYISRYYVFPYVATSDSKYLTADLAKKLVNTGTINHDDTDCFWTDTYYAAPEEMELQFQMADLHIVEHFAQDGITPKLGEDVNNWNDEQFKIWCDYHYSVCREKSLLGASGHGLIIGCK